MFEFLALVEHCAPAVHPQTMQALVKTESGFNPYAIGINGGVQLERQPQTKEQAVAVATRLIAEGKRIDMGLAQINSVNLAALGLTVEQVFEPCQNLAAAATILEENYARARRAHGEGQKGLEAALSAYNTGNPLDGIANGYVQKVIHNADRRDYGVPALIPGSVDDSTPVMLSASPRAKPKAWDVYAQAQAQQRSRAAPWDVFLAVGRPAKTAGGSGAAAGAAADPR
jgi:type IV secretion system protein VirB1